MHPSLPDPEWTALEAGLKPAIRMLMSAGRAARLAERMSARDLQIATRTVPAPRGWPAGDPQAVLLYVSRSRDRVEALRAAEAVTFPDTKADARRRLEAHAEVGRLLGYPECCVLEFVERSAQFDGPESPLASLDEDYVHARSAVRATSTEPRARLNNLLWHGGGHLLTFYPCRYDCPAALGFADAVFAALSERAALAAEALDRALACTVVLQRDGTRTVGEAPASGVESASTEGPLVIRFRT